MKIQSPRRTKKFASALLTVGVVGGTLAAPAVAVGAQASTACGAAPAGYNVIESNASTITGTSGNDFICAGNGDNVIKGGAGDDIIFGRGGNDRIVGGADNDTLHGGDGRDRMFGGKGNDVLNGNKGGDDLFGNRGNDLLNGGKGFDDLWGGNGEDVLNGNLGNDRVRGEGNADILTGGGGNDTLNGGNGLNAAIGGSGADVCFNAATTDTACEILDGVDLSNPSQTILLRFPNGTMDTAEILGRNWDVNFAGEENITLSIPGFQSASTEVSNGRWFVDVPNSALLFTKDVTATNLSTTQVLETAVESYNYNANTQNLVMTGTTDATVRVLVYNADEDLIFVEQVTFDASGNGSTNLSEVDDLDSIEISRQDSDGDIELYQNVHMTSAG